MFFLAVVSFFSRGGGAGAGGLKVGGGGYDTKTYLLQSKVNPKVKILTVPGGSEAGRDFEVLLSLSLSLSISLSLSLYEVLRGCVHISSCRSIYMYFI